MTRTFVDSGVLIAAARGVGTIQQVAEAILFDPKRTFASSLFVQMEVLPKPLYFKRLGEVSYYQRFFARVAVWATCDEALVQEAYEEAQATGLAALDALHVAAARRMGAEELVTSEGLTKPLHRARSLKVVTIQP